MDLGSWSQKSQFTASSVPGSVVEHGIIEDSLAEEISSHRK